ncbi:MAG TPA: pyridoxal-phosphate dependent enzyme [Solirubrobacterales bacterium]|nr:pyridoxal-phosphate dependent enzyme [Solirubrobacterales bacterium]
MTPRERAALYKRLKSVVGGTPLRKLEQLSPDPRSSIYMKLEYLNPTGSHYDRIMLELLRSKEKSGDIEVGDALLDTTTGNSGASLAWLSRALGFKCHVLIPEDAPRARIDQIESYGGAVDYSEPGQYTKGLIETYREESPAWWEMDHHVVLNHAGGGGIAAAATAMGKLGEEIIRQFQEIHRSQMPTHLIVGLGNGASVHIAKPLLSSKCIGFEPIEAPLNFIEMHGKEELESRYGTPPPESLKHGLWGTGAWSDGGFPWPIMRHGWDLLDDIVLVEKEQWSVLGPRLADQEGLHVGRSSAAGVAVAQQIVEVSQEPVQVICIAYDAAWKYLGDKQNG